MTDTWLITHSSHDICWRERNLRDERISLSFWLLSSPLFPSLPLSRVLIGHLSSPRILICLVSAPEASWWWAFDPSNTLQVDLYHQLRTQCYFGFVPQWVSQVRIRWFPLDGFDTRWIPGSISCSFPSSPLENRRGKQKWVDNRVDKSKWEERGREVKRGGKSTCKWVTFLYCLKAPPPLLTSSQLPQIRVFTVSCKLLGTRSLVMPHTPTTHCNILQYPATKVASFLRQGHPNVTHAAIHRNSTHCNTVQQPTTTSWIFRFFGLTRPQKKPSEKDGRKTWSERSRNTKNCKEQEIEKSWYWVTCVWMLIAWCSSRVFPVFRIFFEKTLCNLPTHNDIHHNSIYQIDKCPIVISCHLVFLDSLNRTLDDGPRDMMSLKYQRFTANPSWLFFKMRISSCQTHQQHSATQCNTVQHSATQCNTL